MEARFDSKRKVPIYQIQLSKDDRWLWVMLDYALHAIDLSSNNPEEAHF